MNLKDDFVSVRVADKLKENMFQEWCDTFYINGHFNHGTPIQNSFVTDGFVTAPTLSFAMKWLCEKYNIFISVIRGKGFYIVDVCDDNGYSFYDSEDYKHYTSYYDAIEETLFNVLSELKTLIDLGYVKEKEIDSPYEGLDEFEYYAKHIEQRYDNNPMAFLAAMDMAAYIKDKMGTETADCTAPTSKK